MRRVLLALGALLAAASLTTLADAGPKKPKKPAPAPAPAPAPVADEPVSAEATFDRQAAISALQTVDLARCKATNATRGEGHVVITFLPAGTATNAVVDKGPWLGTPVAKCIAKAFGKAKVPAFKGDAVTVGKSFRFE
jgi:hypothetical protein